MGSDVYVVSGGNGYIGSHMCRFLHERGENVHIIDNYSTSPSKPTHSYGTFHHIDIGAGEELCALLKNIKASCVFHFSARALVPEGEADPFLYYRENLIKTLMLLESCHQAGVKKFVFSSTCATFGVPDTEKISEKNAQNPINTYGNTKKLLELAMRDLGEKKLMDFVIFRYFNAAGCSPDGKIGENHDPETHLIPNLCKSYLEGGESTFKIFGTDYPTPDGTCIRDYIHVNDLVKTHFDGANYLNENHGFFDFNLGSSTGYSVKEVVDTFKKVSGSDLPVELMGRRAGDPPQLVGDSSKAKEVLGFNPQMTLEDSITHTLNYFRLKKDK